MAKKVIRRTKYSFEDNIKRTMFLNPSSSSTSTPSTTVTTIVENTAFATRAETQDGILTDKALNPDTGAYAYDRLRSVGKHAAGKATAMVNLSISGGRAQPDCLLSNVFRLVVTEDIELASPANPLGGQTINIIIKQDGTGGHAITLGAKYTFQGGTTPTFSTGASAKDMLSCQYDSTDNGWLCVLTTDFPAPGEDPDLTPPTELSVFATPTICQAIGSSTVTTNSTQVTASGGTPPYTYLWEGTTADALSGDITAVLPTSAITSFTGNVSGGSLSGQFLCTVTDSGAPALTGTATVSALLLKLSF